MSRFVKRVLPLCLASILAFLSCLPVKAAGVDDVVGLENQYNIVWQNPGGDVCSLDLSVNSQVYFFMGSGSDNNGQYNEYGLYVYAVNHCFLTYGTTLNGSSQYGGCSNKQMFGSDVYCLDASRVGLDVFSYSDNVLIFSGITTLESYLDSGDMSGLLYGEGSASGGTGSGTGATTDEILDGIWGGIVDEEVVLEEDDGTVIGALRTWIKNLANMITNPFQTIQKLLKKLPSAFLGVWVNSEFGHWVQGMYETFLLFPEELITYFLSTDFGKTVEAAYTTLLTIPLAIANEFKESELGQKFFGAVATLEAIPLAITNAFWESEAGEAIKGAIATLEAVLEKLKAAYITLVTLPNAIAEATQNKLKEWFIPSKADWKMHLENYDAFAREKFGFLYYPFEVGVDLLGAYLNVEPSGIITVPGWSFDVAGSTVTIWEPMDVDMDAIGIFEHVRVVTSILQVTGLVALAQAKWEDWIAEEK